MPLIRAIDWWVVKHQHHPCLADIPDPNISPIALVQTTYLTGITNIRDELIGEQSKLQRSLRASQNELTKLCTQQERVLHRLKEALEESSDARTRSLLDARTLVNAERRRTELLIHKIQHLIAQISAYLLECEVKVKKLAGSMGDAELMRDIQASKERNDVMIANANRIILEEVQRLGTEILRLQAIVESAFLPTHVTPEDMDDYFSRLDHAAERVVELETIAERIEETNELDDTDASVH